MILYVAITYSFVFEFTYAIGFFIIGDSGFLELL